MSHKTLLAVFVVLSVILTACAQVSTPEPTEIPTKVHTEPTAEPAVQRSIILSAFTYQNDNGKWLGESGPFLNRLENPEEVSIPLCDKVVEGDLFGQPVSIITMGAGKVEARACGDSLLRYYNGTEGIKEVIWSGISGFSPKIGGIHGSGEKTVIGDVCVSPIAVDWDLQHSAMSDTKPDKWWLMNWEHQHRVTTGDMNLTKEIWNATNYVEWPELPNGPLENTLKYHGEARKPKAFHWSQCSEVTGDNFWHSDSEDSRARELIADALTDFTGSPTSPDNVIAVTAMENTAWMSAVADWIKMKNEYIPMAYVRSSSNFDQPWLNDQGEPAVDGATSINAGMEQGGSTIGCVTAALPILKMFEIRAGQVEMKNPVKAAFVYIGPPGDLGWTYEHDRGRKVLEQQLGGLVKTTYVENVPEGPDATRVIRQYAQEGWDVIFTTSFGYMDPTVEVAKEFPDVLFKHCSGYKTAENMATYFGRIYQARYLSGIVAGEMTDSNIIGYVAAFPIPEVIRGINAFTLGVRSVNSDAEIHVVWTNTWYDPVKEREAAEALLDEGADTIAQHQDTTEPQKAAAERNALSIGYDSDMRQFVGDTVLTSPQWNWGTYYVNTVQNIIDGVWESHQFWGGLETGVVKLAEMSPMVPNDVRQQVDAERERITGTDWDVFCGPFNDQDGNEAVASGEYLSDEEMLNLNWFVEGVVGEIPK
jgi:basic membrane protein A